MTQCLKLFRRERGMTQSDLAELLQISQSQVSFLERGKRRVDPVRVRRFSELTGIPKSQFRPDVFDE